VLVEALDLASDDAVEDVFGLAGSQRLGAVYLALGGDFGLGNLVAAHPAGGRGRHLHGDVADQLLELGRLGDEVSLAVDLAETAYLPARMDVRPDGAVAGRTPRLLRGLGEAALAEKAQRLLEVAVRLAQRLLAVEQPGAGLLAQLLDALQGHPPTAPP